MKEIYRVLKDGGICLYLHEPSCRQYLYKLAFERVNRKRPKVPEDVLLFKKFKELPATSVLQLAYASIRHFRIEDQSKHCTTWCYRSCRFFDTIFRVALTLPSKSKVGSCLPYLKAKPLDLKEERPGVNINLISGITEEFMLHFSFTTIQ